MHSLLLCVVSLVLYQHARVGANQYQNPSDGWTYLVKFGYLAPPDPYTGSLVSYEDYEKSIKDFQTMNGLVPTGEIDNITLAEMNKARCGVSDKLGTDRFATRKKRYTLQGSRWYKNRLTYYIVNYSLQMSRAVIRENLRLAFDIWSDHANLTITESSTQQEADILIKFANMTHGDSFPFDGKGGVLAHAFFPERGGDMHFDDNERWVVGADAGPGGIDFLFAAVHEFGHSLGLGHSDVRNSIMAPIYRGHVPNLQLKPDDIQALQSLYGRKTPITPGGPDTLPDGSREVIPASAATDLCADSSIDGITTTEDGTTYIFKGIYYWLLRTDGRLLLDPAYPQRIQTGWSGLRGNIDSVYTDSTGKTFFFVGSNYWEFENRDPVVRTGNISDRFPGLPAAIDAIFTWTGNGKTYAIKGGNYYRVMDDGAVGDGYPRDITIWTGLPFGRIDAAINFQNSRTYFFSGGDYYRFNDRQFEVDAGYPLPTASRWFGCVANILSNEGLYNQQWLVAGDNAVFTQTYPPDVTLNSVVDPENGAAVLTGHCMILVSLALLYYTK